MTDTLNEKQTAALRELARGSFVLYPSGRWGRRAGGPSFHDITMRALGRMGYLVVHDARLRLTPAGLDAARLRGFLPQLAKLAKGDSLLPAGRADQ